MSIIAEFIGSIVGSVVSKLVEIGLSPFGLKAYLENHPEKPERSYDKRLVLRNTGSKPVFVEACRLGESNPYYYDGYELPFFNASNPIVLNPGESRHLDVYLPNFTKSDRLFVSDGRGHRYRVKMTKGLLLVEPVQRPSSRRERSAVE